MSNEPQELIDEEQTSALAATAQTVAGHRSSLLGNEMFLPVLSLIGCGLIATMIPPVPDHGYQFYLAEQILDGARLYVDVAAADMHPPLFTWLAAALEAVGRLVGVDGLTLYPIAVSLVIAGSLFAAWRIGPQSNFLFAVLVLALIPLAGPYFGQGDQLALALALPYLAAAASEAPRGRGARLAIALAAGFGLAMKPYFALVWLGTEVYLARSRGRRSFLRIESVTIAVLFALYVIATAVFTPEFFRLLPWLMELYPRFAPRSFADIILDWRAALLVLGLAAGRTVRGNQSKRLADLLSITALAMFASMLLQKKGWGYHWYPVNAIAVVLCGMALRSLAERTRVVMPAMVAATIIWMHFQVERTAGLLAGQQSYLPQMMDLIEEHAQGASIQALTHTLNVGFPLVNFTGVGWAAPYAHLWMIPAIYDRAWRGRAPLVYRQSAEWATLEQEMFDRLWERLEGDDVALLLVLQPLNNGFDMRAYFETDPRFRERFARSPVIDTVGHYIVFGRAASDE